MLRSLLLAITLLPFAAVANIFDSNGDNTSSTNKLIFGAEINPITFIASDDSRVYFNAGASIFNRQNSTEISIPVDYKNIQSGGDQFTVLSISGHYRKFFDQDIEGYYFSGVSRLTTINSDTTKIGIGFGLGYRKMFESGLYWGAGVVIGRYFGDNNQDKSSLNSFDTIEDKSIMVDVEVLKIGLLF